MGSGSVVSWFSGSGLSGSGSLKKPAPGFYYMLTLTYNNNYKFQVAADLI